MKKEKKERISLAEAINSRLDIPPDLLPNGTMIELRSRNALTVSGCGRILLYTPKEIRLDMKGDILSVIGERLVCSSYHAGAVGIDGLITTLSFEQKEG